MHSEPRGAEKSVAMIAGYLKGCGHDVIITAARGVFEQVAASADCVLTWATAAPLTHEICTRLGVPYILMIRWWRLIQPLPPGRLLERPIDTEFVERHRPIFEDAHAVVTNNRWATKVIKRYYGVLAHVSYVPKPSGGVLAAGNPYGSITIITPDKDLGEKDFVSELATLMPEQKFLAVNSGGGWGGANVEHMPYAPDMEVVYRRSKFILYPIYHNDVCGTSRVKIEAAQYGVPCIANDRCGFLEQGGVPVSDGAPASEWAERIGRMDGRYPAHSFISGSEFMSYRDNIDIFKTLVESC